MYTLSGVTQTESTEELKNRANEMQEAVQNILHYLRRNMYKC